MMIKKTFCEKCRNERDYITQSTHMVGTLKGREYSYTGTEAHCKVCNAPVYVAEIADANLKALYDTFRKENGIISLDKVRAIPKKYNIGKRPLSLLLGWGETTFSRYYDGDIPTKQYSDILQNIYGDPEYYLKVLEINRENLRSQHTYEKTYKTAKDLLTHQTIGKGKINLIVQYLLNQCEDITPLALQKALYYIQGFNYAFYKNFLFLEDCQAWVHGPVYPTIYARYRTYHFDPIKNVDPFDASVFSASEKAICDSVIANICCYSGKTLEYFTHSENPWIMTRGNLPVTSRSDRIIKKQLIGQYFDKVRMKFHMVDPRDIKDYTQNMFQQL